MEKNKGLRKLSFILSIVGIAVLLSMLIFPAATLGNIADEEIKEKVYFEGKVENERDIGENKLLSVGGMEVICDCHESYLGKEIIVEGVIEEYLGEKQLRVLKIQDLS